MKAVIKTGGKQYVVAKGDEFNVELVGDEKALVFEPLMLIGEKSTKIGSPTVKGAKVTAEVLVEDMKTDKVKIMKFQAKKRVRTLTGHRQHVSRIKITEITG